MESVYGGWRESKLMEGETDGRRERMMDIQRYKGVGRRIGRQAA